MEFKLSSRLLVMCVVTNDCNQVCKHCVVGAKQDSKEQLDFSMVDQLLKDICELTDDSLVSFVGGEATVWPYFFDILDSKSFQKIKFKMLYTNATALSLAKIQKIKTADFYEVRISIDSDRKDEHDDLRGEGSFEIMETALKEMINSGIPVTAASVLKKNNIVRIDELLRYLRNNGVQYVHLLPFYYNGRGEYQRKYAIDAAEMQKTVQRVKEQYPSVHGLANCENGTAYFKVNYNGDCILQYEREKILLGNLHQSTFKNLYEKAVAIFDMKMISCKKCCFYNNPILCRNMNKYCIHGVQLI